MEPREQYQIELYQEFERVVVDPEHSGRESEEAREEEIRTSGRRESEDAGVIPQPGRSYARRILDLIRKPHEQWNGDDFALASRVVEDARFTALPAQQELRREAREGKVGRKLKIVRDEFDRRLWGLPARPNLSR